MKATRHSNAKGLTAPDGGPPAAQSMSQVAAKTGRHGLIVRVNPEARRQLKILAAELDTTMQSLTVEAINSLVRKHKKPPIAVSE